MVTFTNRSGITLSANAVQNGAALHVQPVTTPGAGDYAERAEGRDRRKVRRAVSAAKRSFLSGM